MGLETGVAGCGCAYPDDVDDDEVERSNTIMMQLRRVASHCPQLTERLSALPMHLVARVGDLRIGIVHGDAHSLAGWEFAHDQLHASDESELVHDLFDLADVEGKEHWSVLVLGPSWSPYRGVEGRPGAAARKAPGVLTNLAGVATLHR